MTSVSFTRHVVRALVASASSPSSSSTSSSLQHCQRFLATSSVTRSDAHLTDTPVGTISVDYSSHRPTLTIPLPSYDAMCIFTLRPVSHTVADLCRHIADEDPGVDRVLLYRDHARLAGSTPIESILTRGDGTETSTLVLRINDKHYNVEHINVPEVHTHFTSSELSSTAQMKTEIAALYATLQVDEHQLAQERRLLQELEALNAELVPMEEKRRQVMALADKRADVAGWFGLAAMGIQFGTFARLTWWEYSWDIMEPVTYFATYMAQIGMFSYWLMTKQNYEYDGAHKRVMLLSFYAKAKLHRFDVDGYNELRTKIEELEHDLKRIRDPLHMHLPLSRLKTLQARERLDDADKEL